jgi:hypothetical protein
MSLWQIFRWPLMIGLLTAVGLVSGLVSDGWGDALAALGLFTPAAVAAWFCWRRQRPALAPGEAAGNASQAEPAVRR